MHDTCVRLQKAAILYLEFRSPLLHLALLLNEHSDPNAAIKTHRSHQRQNITTTSTSSATDSMSDRNISEAYHPRDDDEERVPNKRASTGSSELKKKEDTQDDAIHYGAADSLIRFEDDSSDDGEDDIPSTSGSDSINNKPFPSYMAPLRDRKADRVTTYAHVRASRSSHRPYLFLTESGQTKRAVQFWRIFNMVDFKIISMDDILLEETQPHGLPRNPLDCSGTYLKGMTELMQAIKVVWGTVSQ